MYIVYIAYCITLWYREKTGNTSWFEFISRAHANTSHCGRVPSSFHAPWVEHISFIPSVFSTFLLSFFNFPPQGKCSLLFPFDLFPLSYLLLLLLLFLFLTSRIHKWDECGEKRAFGIELRINWNCLIKCISSLFKLPSTILEHNYRSKIHLFFWW